MSIKKKIVVIDWTNIHKSEGEYLKLTLTSDQRKILRGKRVADCNKELYLQLPRDRRLDDGDILITNYDGIFVEIIAKKENLLEINGKSNLELLKTAYHLGNRHVELEITKDGVLTKSDYLIEELIKNFNVTFFKVEKKFFPEKGAFNHE